MDLALRLLVGVAIVMLAVAAARWWQSRRRTDAPTQPRGTLPEQIDRADFDRPETPWLVAVFTSDTCTTCADVADKALVLDSDSVAVQIVSYQRDAELQRRYDIDSVPSLIVADADGVVQGSAIGPITATDLWASVANLREPGSVDVGHCDHDEPRRPGPDDRARITEP